MKFWKQTLLTSFIFFSAVICVFFTACERNPCDKLTCKNAGSCVSGFCHCPSGFEGAECQDSSITRYLGVYAGYTSCNQGANLIDTTVVFPGPTTTTVGVAQKGSGDTLYGTVFNNSSSTYSIFIPGDTTGNYSKTETITLQTNKLIILTDVIGDINYDTTKTVCTFTGFK